jgi:hypothetical protein
MITLTKRPRDGLRSWRAPHASGLPVNLCPTQRGRRDPPFQPRRSTILDTEKHRRSRRRRARRCTRRKPPPAAHRRRSAERARAP